MTDSRYEKIEFICNSLGFVDRSKVENALELNGDSIEEAIEWLISFNEEVYQCDDSLKMVMIVRTDLGMSWEGCGSMRSCCSRGLSNCTNSDASIIKNVGTNRRESCLFKS